MSLQTLQRHVCPIRFTAVLMPAPKCSHWPPEDHGATFPPNTVTSSDTPTSRTHHHTQHSGCVMEATSEPLMIQEGESGIHKDRRAEAGNRHRRDCKSQGQTPAPFPLPLQPLEVISVDSVSGQHLTPFHLPHTHSDSIFNASFSHSPMKQRVLSYRPSHVVVPPATLPPISIPPPEPTDPTPQSWPCPSLSSPLHDAEGTHQAGWILCLFFLLANFRPATA